MNAPDLCHSFTHKHTDKLELRNNLVSTIKSFIIQQARLIQLPLAELLDEIKTEFIENPYIEMVSRSSKAASANDDRIEERRSGSDELREYEKEIETSGLDWASYYNDLEKISRREVGAFEYREPAPLENFAVADETLCKHLSDQLYQKFCSERKIEIGKVVIGFINGKGFLTASAREIAAQAGLKKNVTVGEVNEVIEAIQEFDPSGICARTAAESILLQYRALCQEKPRPGNIADKIKEILENHFVELAEKKYQSIAKKLSITTGQVEECVKFIVKNFNPWPGLQYASDDRDIIVKPEVFVTKKGGDYVVKVKHYKIPEIRIDPEYVKLLKLKDLDPRIKDLINRKFNRALFIKKSIEKRCETIKKVMECIVSKQKEYFDHGPAKLKPLKMDELCGETGLNESTVSRVASGKFVETPRGTYEIKFFFSGGLRTSDGGMISATAVKHAIKEIVSKEPAKKPHTDQKIAELLAERGIVIARRTVAKYREELNILTTPLRRRKAV